jgi:signal transduction histidine kinase
LIHTLRILGLPALLVVALCVAVYQTQLELTQSLYNTQHRERTQLLERASNALNTLFFEKLDAVGEVARTPAVAELTMTGRSSELVESLGAWQSALRIPVLALFERDTNTLYVPGQKPRAGEFYGLTSWISDALSDVQKVAREPALELFRGYPTLIKGHAVAIAGEPRLIFIAGVRVDKNWIERLSEYTHLPMRAGRHGNVQLTAGTPTQGGEWFKLNLPHALADAGYVLEVQLPAIHEATNPETWALWTTSIALLTGLLLLAWLLSVDGFRRRQVMQFVQAIEEEDELALQKLPTGMATAGQHVLEQQRALKQELDLARSRIEQAEQALQHSRRQLRKATSELEQLRVAPRTRSSFLSRMGDEITTPMKSTGSMLKLLSEFQLPEEPRELIGIALRSHQMLASNIENVLDFTKMDAGLLKLFPADFELDVMLRELIAELGPHAEAKGLKLTWNINERVPTSCHGDRQRIRQILYNLVGNAIRFTKQGQVGIYVDTIYDKGKQLIRYSVVDTGVGIPKEAQKTLFESLEEHSRLANSSFAGRLRLIVSKQLAELMGGSIGVTSEPGKGSRFWFTVRYLPPRGL